MTAVRQPTAAGLALPPLEADGFVELYSLHYGRLVSSLRLAGADPQRAQDLAQEAFARTYARWRKVRGGTSPAGYVYRTAYRLLRKRGGLPETPLDEYDSAIPGPEGEAVTEASLHAALEAMPPRRRACAALCLYLGFDTDEAAAMLGISAATVRVQLHRARKALHIALGEDPPPG